MNLSTFDAMKKLHVNEEDCIKLEGELLKRYQNILLSMASDIISVCEDNHIVYMLSGGSCLGAIRHNGFIPWDDDIDIIILGCQLEQFVQSFNKQFKDKYWVGTPKKPGYDSLISTVKLKGTISRGFDNANEEECGISIDLFSMENTYDNSIGRNVHGFFCMACGFLLSCRKFFFNRKRLKNIIGDDRELKKAYYIKCMIGCLISFMSVKQWVLLTNRCYGLSKNNHSKYLTIPTGRNHYFKEMYLRKDMVNTIFHEFSGHQWRIPKAYDEYLTKLYGDYMTIPPECDRETHIRVELKFPGEI